MSDSPDASTTPNVLLVGGGIIPSTHIRLFSPFEWLKTNGMADGRFTFESEVRPDMVDWADAVIIQRGTSEQTLQLIEYVHLQGKPVVYECDDNFLAITKTTPAVGEYYSRPDVRERFTQVLSQADVVTVSTLPLQRDFSRFNADVRVLPNCVDTLMLDRAVRVPNSDRVVLGYAGTVTHGPDFDVLEPVLRRLLNEYGDRLGMQFFGYVPPGFEKYPTVGFVPYSEDYPGFLRALSQVDWSFGIAPLVDRPFNRYKTDNKYREYGICGIPGVYSACQAYAGSVRDGDTGILTPHTQQAWYKALRRMIDEPDTRTRIGAAAALDVSERFTVARAATAWHEVLKNLALKPSAA